MPAGLSWWARVAKHVLVSFQGDWGLVKGREVERVAELEEEEGTDETGTGRRGRHRSEFGEGQSSKSSDRGTGTCQRSTENWDIGEWTNVVCAHMGFPRLREPLASLEESTCASARPSMCVRVPPSFWNDASDMFAFDGSIFLVDASDMFGVTISSSRREPLVFA